VALNSFLLTLSILSAAGFAKTVKEIAPENKLLASSNGFDEKQINDHLLFIEFKDPLEYCERFLKKDMKENCKNLISSKRPDWYFASYCDRIFDDDLFMDCIRKAQITMVEPRKLRLCENPRTDSGIRDCLWKLDAQSRGEIIPSKHSNRMPATNEKENNDSKYSLFSNSSITFEALGITNKEILKNLKYNILS
jgi:hypothetical protein